MNVLHHEGLKLKLRESSDYDEPRSESSESVLQVKINSQRRKNSRPHEKVAPSYSQLHDSNQSAQITFQPSNLRSNVINQARLVSSSVFAGQKLISIF